MGAVLRSHSPDLVVGSYAMARYLHDVTTTELYHSVRVSTGAARHFETLPTKFRISPNG